VAARVLILGLIFIWGVAACAPTPTPAPVSKAIVGQWINADGGTIYFYADNTGFIPGFAAAAEPIPDTRFTYYLQDETHLGIVLEGQTAVVMEIKLEGDKMTWRGLAGTEYLYNRVK
jgi:hypothetical protein